MRLAGQEKMGYYPTPNSLLQAIASYFAPSETKGRLLDPCAGEGEAAAHLGQLLNCQTWGAELSPIRAEEAAKVMDRCFPVAWETTRLTDESITISILNPVYDWDRATKEGEKSQRLEYKFLRSTTPKLVRGQGYLVYIVPQHILGRAEVARYLAGHYDDKRAVRFPDGEYERFEQIVVFGRRREVYDVPTADEVAAVQRLADTPLPPSKVLEEPLYHLIPAPARGKNGSAVRFYRAGWDPEQMVEATREVGVHRTRDWADLHTGGNGMVALQPAMPLKKGHVAMLMSSGMMGTLRLTDKDGKPMLVKGRVVKVPHEVSEEIETDEKGNEEKVVKWRDRFITTVASLSPTGLKIIDDVPGLTTFMQDYGDKIANHILSTYTPRYHLEPTPQESAIVDRLGTERTPLPGQDEAGLLPTQKHAAIAMARSIKANRVGNLQGEMGLGKTTIGAAVIELCNAYPAIVICPPHLVPKWIREIEEVIPGAYATELRRIGRNSEDAGDVNDVRRFLDAHANGVVSPKAVAVVASTSAKFGSGWEPSAPVELTAPKDPEKQVAFEAALREAKKARQAYLEAKRAGLDAEHLKALRRASVRARRKVIEAATPRPALAQHVCPDCGSLVTKVVSDVDVPVTGVKLEKKRHFCTAQVSGWKLDDQGRLERNEDGNPVWGTRECGAPLFQHTGMRRYSIAQYIKEQAKGRFELLIADEVHQYKAKSSDRGVAFHQLVAASRGTLTLTGTFFGGKSSSIFWLLYRLAGGVRSDFGFHDEKRWASLYGVVETVERRGYDEDDDEDGTYTGNRRYRNRAKEVPGVSPAIISRFLDTTSFLNLKDLGVALPSYDEEVVVLDMDAEQQSQYSQMSTSLRALALEEMRYMSSWLQWSLSRPNSAFRDEVVMLPMSTGEIDPDTGEEVIQRRPYMDLPQVVVSHGQGRHLPKERWLANYVQSERARGRKVLVYVRQTGTRDIQDRIKSVLEEAGLRVAVLGGNVSPRKREAWVQKRAPRLDVLITNPRLVETGLDLVQFATIIYYEIEYSLYTLWQACRRVWRLGQTRPVKVVFAVYAGSMEAQALALMGRKMKAAQLLYGDEVGGAIVPEDSGDFLTELAREVLEGKELPDLRTLFADDGQVSESPMGSLIKVSPPLLTLAGFIEQNGIEVRHGLPVLRRRRKRAIVPQGQMAMFDLSLAGD